MDEAHNIKNHEVQTSIAVCQLQACARWAVTGTPIQNNLLDMYSLLKSIVQSYLRRHEGEDNQSEEALMIHSVEWPGVWVQRPCMPHSHGLTECQQEERTVSAAEAPPVLLPSFFVEDGLDPSELKSEGLDLSLEEQLSALTLSEFHDAELSSTVALNGKHFQVELFEDTRESTKILCLLEKLEAIRREPGSQKSVIVSQWTSMLKVVARHLRRHGLTYDTIDGSVNSKQRMDLVEAFNTSRSPQVMLISLTAGGVGLNLTGGNHLFLMDMHWNPSLEDQACDRIYRLGQKKDVFIHRFVCKGTVEEKILELQEKKKNLAKDVLSGSGEFVTKLSLDDYRVLFDI